MANSAQERAYPYLTHGVGHFLGQVAEWCQGNGLPPLNSLAVNAETKMPGDGYYTAAGRSSRVVDGRSGVYRLQ